MKKLCRITILALIMLICFSAFAVSAFAAETQSVEIPAKVSVIGPKPNPPEKYNIVLKSLDGSNPMPAGSEDNVYNLSITGEGEKSFPSIEFSNVGSYNYIIYQLAGEAANAIYDTTVYKVIVYVLNSEIAEDTLITYVVIRNEVTGEKVKEVAFTNRYAPDVPKTGDNSNFVLYATLCIVFAVAMISIALFGKKRKYDI